jgi:hypothetical protein
VPERRETPERTQAALAGRAEQARAEP